MTDPNDVKHNERGDVWQRTYAFHPSPLDVGERSADYIDLCDRLDYRARITEAGDRKTAQLLREAAARIDALESLVFTLKTTKPCEMPEGGA